MARWKAYSVKKLPKSNLHHMHMQLYKVPPSSYIQNWFDEKRENENSKYVHMYVSNWFHEIFIRWSQKFTTTSKYFREIILSYNSSVKKKYFDGIFAKKSWGKIFEITTLYRPGQAIWHFGFWEKSTFCLVFETFFNKFLKIH